MSDKKRSQETTDGLPPGAHAPSSMGTGAPSVTDSDTPDVDPTQPEGQVDDPKASPKEQAEHAKALAELGPLQKGFKRVKLTSNVTVNGQHKMAGDIVDIEESEVHSLRNHHEPLQSSAKR